MVHYRWGQMRVIRGSYGVIRGRLPPLNRTVISRTPDFTNVKFMTFASGRRLRSKLVRMTFHDFCFREAIEVKTCSYDIRRYGLRPAFGRPQPVHDPETAFGRPSAGLSPSMRGAFSAPGLEQSHSMNVFKTGFKNGLTHFWGR